MEFPGQRDGARYPPMHRTAPVTRFIQPQMLVVLRLRNPYLPDSKTDFCLASEYTEKCRWDCEAVGESLEVDISTHW